MVRGRAADLNWSTRFNHSLEIELIEDDKWHDNSMGTMTLHVDDVWLMTHPACDPYFGDSPCRRNPYSFTGHRADYQLFYTLRNLEGIPSAGNFILRLLTLRCNNAQQREDNVYITVNGRRVWGPVRMVRHGLTQRINSNIRFQSGATITLWEARPRQG